MSTVARPTRSSAPRWRDGAATDGAAIRSRTSCSSRACASAMWRTSTVPGDAAELGQPMQEDEAGRGVEFLEPAAVEDAVLAGQAQRLDLGGDRRNMGQPPAPLEVQDVGAALQFGCDPHRQGCECIGAVGTRSPASAGAAAGRRQSARPRATKCGFSKPGLP